MTSRNLLNNLKPYWTFIEELKKSLIDSTGIVYTPLLKQSYNFIYLELRDKDEELFLQIKYQINPENHLSIYSYYCENEDKATQLKSWANKLIGYFKWETDPIGEFDLDQKQISYLKIADRVASLGNDINATPSHYGKLILTSDFIKLEQINRLNSRSLDHKDSYFIRDLYFVIPLKEEMTKKEVTSLGFYYIGNMKVYFNDNSSEMNRRTGEEISEQINKEIEVYKINK